MPQDVDIPIVRANFEEDILRSVPLVEHLLDHILMPVHSKTERPFLRVLPLTLTLERYPQRARSVFDLLRDG